MTKQREMVADDFIRQPLPEGGGDLEVVPALKEVELKKAAELEAFMNEPVTIEVSQSTDPNATPAVEVAVNGRRIFLPRGVCTVKRMYVERLARAKRTGYSQNLDPRLGEGVNTLLRNTALDYPFTLVEDKNPLGREWLSRILAEAA